MKVMTLTLVFIVSTGKKQSLFLKKKREIWKGRHRRKSSKGSPTNILNKRISLSISNRRHDSKYFALFDLYPRLQVTSGVPFYEWIQEMYLIALLSEIQKMSLNQ